MLSMHFTILQMHVHEEYHLLSILQEYLASMWYVFSWEIQILNCPLTISCWFVFASCYIWGITLWGSNMLCVYYKPRKCVYFEVFPLRVDIVNYLVPRWHVFSTSSIVLIFLHGLSFGSCMCEIFLIRFTSIIYVYILFGNHLLQGILFIACMTCCLFEAFKNPSVSIALNSYLLHFLCLLLWRWSYISLLPNTGNLLQILLVLQQLVFLYVVELIGHLYIGLCLIALSLA